MEKVSATVEDRHVEMLDEHPADSRSEALREILDEREDLRDRVDDLEDKLEHQEARAEDLRRQLREANRRDDDVDELVEYVERERSVEQRRREASIVTRARWWLTGMDAEDEDD